MSIWNELGTLAHETSELDMHPRLQENWRIAQGELESLSKATASIANLGLDDSKPIIDAFFAMKMKKTDELEIMGYTPRVGYLGAPVDMWEVPASFVMTLGSSSSPKAATILVQYTDINDKGYGDLASATFTVDNVWDTLELAEERLLRIVRAIATVKAVEAESLRANGEARVKASYGPSF
jgi:hypothetical protein